MYSLNRTVMVCLNPSKGSLCVMVKFKEVIWKKYLNAMPVIFLIKMSYMASIKNSQ